MGGLEFGSLPVTIRRIVYYTLSPLEQNPWRRVISRGIPNISVRFLHALIPITPAVLFYAGCYAWAVTEYECSLRKDPRAFENDE